MSAIETSQYAGKSAREREALAANRKVGEEAPKCAAYFDHSVDCDLFRSHICGPSEIALAYQKLFKEVS